MMRRGATEGKAEGEVSVLWRWSACTPGAPAQARAALRRVLDQLGYQGEVISDAVLATSEFVANAMEHAVGPYELRLMHTSALIVCEVVDCDPRIPDIAEFPAAVPFSPDPAARGGGMEALCHLLKERGRGLQIVDYLTEKRWGFRITAGGKKIAWAAFPVRSHR